MIKDVEYYEFVKNKAIIKIIQDDFVQCYCIDTKGNLLFKFPKNTHTFRIENENIFIVTNYDNYTEALFDVNGKQLTDFKYSHIVDTEEKLFKVQNSENKKWGYINLEGEEIIPCIYDNAYDYFFDGLAIVYLNGKRGAINTNGDVVIPINYNKLDFCSEGYIVATDTNYNQFIIDKKNNVIIPPVKYRRYYSGFSCGLIPTSDGYYNTNGKKLRIKEFENV